MTKKLKKCAILAFAACLSVSVSTVVFNKHDAKVKAGYGYQDAFEYTTDAVMKYKATYADKYGKGLALYSYDKGAKATFKGSLSGVFEADFSLLDGNDGVKTLSFALTDSKTEKTVKLSTEFSAAGGNAYVEYDGERAGLVYNEQDGNLHGYTALYNRDGNYTSFDTNGKLKFRFNPGDGKFYVTGGNGKSVLVWDFSNNINDGKELVSDFGDLQKYRVSICFDDVKTGTKAGILLYSFGGMALDKSNVDAMITLSANFEVNATVGKSYTLPQGVVEDVFTGGKGSENVTVKGYYNDGSEVDVAYGEFTPDKEGEYYFYYSYYEGKATAFYSINAYEQDNFDVKFSTEHPLNRTSFGRYTKIAVPAYVASGNYSLSNAEYNAAVTVKKDGKVVKDYENVDGGFVLTLEEIGDYELIYTVPEWGDAFSKTIIVTCDDALKGVNLQDVPEEIALGETLTIIPAKIFLSGSEVTANVYVVDPSGEAKQTNLFKPEKIGKYVIEHRYDGGVEKQYVTVKDRYADLFTCGKNSSVTYGKMEGNNSVYGHTLHLANNSVVTYNKVIDLNKIEFDDTLEDRNQNKPLIEFIAQPKTVGRTDITGLYVVLTDVNDPENTVTMRFKYLDYVKDSMWLRTKASGQGYVGYYYGKEIIDNKHSKQIVDVHNAQGHEDGGFMVQSSFIQRMQAGHNMLDDSVKVYFSNDKSTLYAKPWDFAAPLEGDTWRNSWAVREYASSDEKMLGGDSPWKGFSTGEVYMSIYGVGIESSADITITTIGGEKVGEEFVKDTTKPTVNVSENLPYGEVGKEYKIPEFSVKDDYSGVVKKGVTVVYNGNTIPVNDNGFIPTAEGTYKLSFYAEDAFGNREVKTADVTVRESASAPTVAFTGGLPATAYVGQWITIPSYETDGNYVTATVKAYLNEEEIEIRYGRVFLSSAGVLKIRVEAADYNGNEATPAEITLSGISYSIKPIFDEAELVLPKEFIHGDTFEFAEYKAKFYSASTGANGISVPAKITVIDGAGEVSVVNGKYKPTVSDTVTAANVKIEFAYNGESVSYEKTVPVKKISTGYGFMASYFVTENATAEASGNAVWFTAEENGSYSADFIRKIDCDALYFALRLDDYNADNNFIVRLTSAANGSTVNLFVKTSKGKCYLSLDGENYAFMNFNIDKCVYLSYSPKNRSIHDYYGTKILTIDSFADGKEFDGFGGGVYLGVTVDNATAGEKIGIASIANQAFNDNRADRIIPTIYHSFSLSGSFTVGKKISLPTVKAYDVLNATDTIKLSVYSGDKVLLDSVDASTVTEFTLEEIGQYQFYYSVLDSKGNKAESNVYVFSVQESKPELAFNGEFPETIKVGSELKLPSYVKNDADIDVKIYYSSAGSVLKEVTGKSVKITQKGIYTVYYVLTDKNGNMNFYSFTIKAV